MRHAHRPLRMLTRCTFLGRGFRGFYGSSWFLSGHRAANICVPLSRFSQRTRRRRGRWHRQKQQDHPDEEKGRGSATYGRFHLSDTLMAHGDDYNVTSDVPADTPSQRVHAILGMEDGDQEHAPPLFTELDELTVAGEEWKETAR